MKYIFVIQGEGRGHITQALALSQLLRRAGHSVDEVLIGRCQNREIPKFFVDKIGAKVTPFDSPTIDYGRKGKRGSMLATLTKNLTPAKISRWKKSVDMIANRIKRSDADVIISFYEFLLGFVNLTHSIDKPIICIGHQFMIDHHTFPLRSMNDNGITMLRLNNMVCSHGATKKLALSFYDFPNSRPRRIEVVPPLLRGEIFDLEPTTGDYMLGYMLNPAYLNDVIEWKRRNPEIKVHLFWDKKDAPEEQEVMDGLWVHKLNDSKFLKLMAGCRGYVTTAGFESVCEALYFGKPTLMIPVHIEQQINAADAMRVDAGGQANEFDLSKLTKLIEDYKADTETFRKWVDSAEQKFLHALTEI